MISVRWGPSSWMQFSSLFLKIFHDTGQQLTIARTNFLTDGFLQIIQRTAVCKCKHAISNTPKGKKSHVERSGERGGHGTSPKREMRCRETCFEQWSLTKSPLLLKWPTQRKRMPTTSFPPSADLLSTTHSKYVRFPWVTLYNTSYIIKYNIIWYSIIYRITKYII